MATPTNPNLFVDETSADPFAVPTVISTGTNTNNSKTLIANYNDPALYATPLLQITNDVGGSKSQVQFHNGVTFGGSSNLTYEESISKLSLRGNMYIYGNLVANINTNLNNLRITGGLGNQILATDGTGNLSWVSYDPSISGGIFNGSSNVIVYPNSDIRFSSAGISNVTIVNSEGITTGNITADGITANSIEVANFANLGSNSNVIITGGLPGQFLKTDGAGNISWDQPSGIYMSDTVPFVGEGNVWFNTAEGRAYVSYDGTWVDMSPAILPDPDMYANTITFPDGSMFTTASGGLSGDFIQNSTTQTTVATNQQDVGVTVDNGEGGNVTFTFNNNNQLEFGGEAGMPGLLSTTDIDIQASSYVSMQRVNATPATGESSVTSAAVWSGGLEFITQRFGGGAFNNRWHMNNDGTTGFPDDAITSPSANIQIRTTGAGNSYSIVDQNDLHWEAFTQNDTDGTHPAWAWINASIQNGLDHPQVFIETQRSSTTANLRWTFDEAGRLITPGEVWTKAGDGINGLVFSTNGTDVSTYIKVDTGQNTVLDSTNNFYAKRAGSDRLAITDTDTTLSATSNVKIKSASGANTWTFDLDGNITFPDGNVQSTAFTGTIPAGSVVGTVSSATAALTAGTVTTAAQSNITSVGVLTSLSLTGNISTSGNVTANVYFGNGSQLTGITATVAQTVSTAAQPNITSVGTLTNLVVSGNINAQGTTDSGGPTSGALKTAGGLGVAKTATIGHHLFVGNGASLTAFTNPTIIAKEVGSDYIQAALVNASDTGSSDWTAYADNGTDGGGWMDMGVTGSAFNDPNYTVTGPNDGYLFAQAQSASGLGGNLVIATGSQGTTNDIIFATGGFQSGNIFGRIVNATKTLDIPAGSANIGGNLYVGGIANIAGNTKISGNVLILEDLHVNGNINFSGSVTQISGASGQFFGDANGIGALYAGIAVGYATVANPVIQAAADTNDYTQINFQNLNAGNTSSTEYAATADNGDDLTNYIDMGIAGGSWDGTQTNSVGDAASSNDGWVYVQGGTGGGNLILGATSTNKSVKILTGGAGNANIRARFTDSGLTVVGNVSAAYLKGDGSNIANIAYANVSGLGNIVTINQDGNASNVLYGNGVFAAAGGGGGSYGNSNVATFLASYGSNTITTTGNVTVGNIIATNIGNISSVNKDGNAANILYGNGVFASSSAVRGQLVADTFIVATQSGSTQLTAAMYRIITTGSVTAFSYILPDTNTCYIGQSFIIVSQTPNYSFSVLGYNGSSGANISKTITAGATLIATVVAQRGGSSADVAGNWSFSWQGGYGITGTGNQVFDTAPSITTLTMAGVATSSGALNLNQVGEKFTGWNYAVNSTTTAVPTAVATGGVFTIPNTTGLSMGQAVTITGTNGGTGSISGYTSGTTYYLISVVTPGGSTSLTLSTTRGSATGVTTTAGTLSGLTMTFAAQIGLSMYQNGGILNVTGTISANFDVTVTTNYTASNAYNITLIINQGATPYMINNFYIGTLNSYAGTAQTISWAGGVTPSGNANKKDVITLSWLPSSAVAATVVFGQLQSFG